MASSVSKADNGWMARGWKIASGWGTRSGPCGGEKPSTNENREFTNGRRSIRAFVKNSWVVSQCGGHFGVGEGVRAGYNNHY